MQNITDNYSTIIFFSLFNLLSFFIIGKYKGKIFFLIDRPDGVRKLHLKSVFAVGGLFVANYLSLILLYAHFFDLKTLFAISLTSLTIFLIGLLDDIFSINAYKKLLIIAIIILAVLNFNDDLKINFLYFSTFEQSIYLGKYSTLVTTLCLLLLINCFNLSDGINALATGISIIWVLFAYFYTLPELQIILFPLIFLLFLIFFSIYKGNFFLGDNGSLVISCFIGLVIIFTYNINTQQNPGIISVESIFILFMVPGIDMFRLFVQRLLKKQDPFQGDRDHLHHLLMDKFSLKISLFLYFSLMLIFILSEKFKLIQSAYLIVIFLIIYSLLIKILKNNKKLL